MGRLIFGSASEAESDFDPAGMFGRLSKWVIAADDTESSAYYSSCSCCIVVCVSEESLLSLM